MLITLPWIVPAYADKWLPPKPQTYESLRGTYRVTIFPGAPQTDAGGKIRCEAVLERLKDGARGYEQVWRKPLTNIVAPMNALVSETDGSFVTFDDWGRKGWGDDVIVLYSGRGSLTKKFSLTDLMSEEGLQKIPAHRSSVHWSGQHQLDYDGRTLNLRIVALEGITAGEEYSGDVELEGEFREIRIDMNSGRVLRKSRETGSSSARDDGRHKIIEAAKRASNAYCARSKEGCEFSIVKTPDGWGVMAIPITRSENGERAYIPGAFRSYYYDDAGNLLREIPGV